MYCTLVSTYNNRSLVPMLDLKLLLELSADKCIIAENKVLNYLGNKLIGRYIIGVGNVAEKLCNCAVDHFNYALEIYKTSGFKEVLFVGFSEDFVRKSLVLSNIHYMVDYYDAKDITHIPLYTDELWYKDYTINHPYVPVSNTHAYRVSKYTKVQ